MRCAVASPEHTGDSRPLSRLDGGLLVFGKSMYLVACFLSAIGMAVLLLVPAVWGASNLRPKGPLGWVVLTAAWLGWYVSFPLMERSTKALSYSLRRAAWRTWPRLAEGEHRESVRAFSIVAVIPVAALSVLFGLLVWLYLATLANAGVLWVWSRF